MSSGTLDIPAHVNSQDVRQALIDQLDGVVELRVELRADRTWQGLKPGSIVSISRDADGFWRHPTKNARICGQLTRTFGVDAGSAKGSTFPICVNALGWRTEHPGEGPCVLHGGAIYATSERAPSGLQVLSTRELRSQMRSLAVPLDVDPVDAITQMVREAAGNVAFLGARVADLGYDLVGDVSALTRDGDAVPVGEDVRSLVKLYNEERDRLGRISKLAIDAGIAEREVRVLEDQATILAEVLRKVFASVTLEEFTKREILSALSEEFRRIGTARNVTNTVEPAKIESSHDSRTKRA